MNMVSGLLYFRVEHFRQHADFLASPLNRQVMVLSSIATLQVSHLA